jgi:ATP-binding cassette subfamily B protein
MNNVRDSQPPVSRDGVTLRQVGAIVRPWRGLLTLVLVSVLVGAALELVPPLVIRQVVDEHISVGRSDGLLLLAGLYLGATALVQALSFVTDYTTAIVAQGALNRLRMRLYAHLQTLPLGYFDRTPLGDTISRCTADVETVNTLFSSGGTGGGGGSGATVLTDMVRLVFIAVAMIILSPFLALIAGLVLLPLLFVTRYVQIRVRDAERANRRAIGLQNTHLQETLGGVEIIRALGREATYIAHFRGALHQALAAFNRATFYAATFIPVVNILAAIATAVVLWVGASDVLASLGISLGTLIAFVLLFQQFVKPITNLGNEWQSVQAALSGLERIFQVLALSPDQASTSNRRDQRAGDGAAIEMQDIVFGYLPDTPVLQGPSIVIRSGEHVAMAGRTGAGKSTALHLLGGLYAPWSGTVRVAGTDPRMLSENDRRYVMGIVPQTIQLFSGTVHENLTLGDREVSDETVRNAAVLAGADSFIQSLPQGYETMLGRGTQLSAGQRQLLALARALVWDPDVLLLDEATAALDSATEATFWKALRTVMSTKHTAVLTVAHRIATAKDADRVLVMDAGRIVEEGSPGDLIRQRGRFAALLELEAAGWDWQSDGGAD